MKNILFIVALLFLYSPLYSQLNIGGKIKEKAQERVENKTEEGIDKGFDKTEEGVNGVFKKKEKEEGESNEEDLEEEPINEETEQNTENNVNTSNQQSEVPIINDDKPSLQSYSKYDFVPGDKILYFEDFSQDNIGDFPGNWTSNSGGEVKTVNIAEGKWFHMYGEDAVYCYSKSIAFPENYIIEFDIIPDAEYSDGIVFTLYEEYADNKPLMNDDLYPGTKGVHIILSESKWETIGYNNEEGGDDLNGQATRNTVEKEKSNHVIIWIQKTRIRIYHMGQKVLDVQTAFFPASFTRMRFSGWDRNSFPYVSNIKITTAAPDMRSKLLTEGKLISYGIYFDSGKDVVKPESYGSINEIATVLKEHPDLRIKIVGHTDADGDNNSNLELSKRRAANVKAALVNEFGIDANRIETDGAGESQPLAPNDNPENKSKNRRVEFIKL